MPWKAILGSLDPMTIGHETAARRFRIAADIRLIVAAADPYGRVVWKVVDDGLYRDI